MWPRRTFCGDSQEAGIISVQSIEPWQIPGLSMTIREKFPDYWKGRNEIETHYIAAERFCHPGRTGVTPFGEGGQTTSQNPRHALVLLEGRQDRVPETVSTRNPSVGFVSFASFECSLSTDLKAKAVARFCAPHWRCLWSLASPSEWSGFEPNARSLAC